MVGKKKWKHVCDLVSDYGAAGIVDHYRGSARDELIFALDLLSDRSRVRRAWSVMHGVAAGMTGRIEESMFLAVYSNEDDALHEHALYESRRQWLENHGGDNS